MVGLSSIKELPYIMGQRLAFALLGLIAGGTCQGLVLDIGDVRQNVAGDLRLA